MQVAVIEAIARATRRDTPRHHDIGSITRRIDHFLSRPNEPELGVEVHAYHGP